ncbi:MAG TPA: hypothetical protein VI980_05090 [Acidimicrobiia bacterium]|nr:hypothetical protein [Acidimicrobiia bacterium]
MTMDSAWARLTMGATLVAVLVLVAVPVGATHTSEHVADQIWAVEVQAEQDIDAVVSAFETEIGGLGTANEVAVAEAAAKDAVDAIWTDARTTITNLVMLYPGLGSIGNQAKQQLLEKRNDARAQISDLAAAWVPAVTTTTTSTTTTTVGPSTTTTTPATTTTTSHGPGSGVVPPPPGNGNGDGNGQGGPTPTTLPGIEPDPTPPGGSEPPSPSTTDDPAGSNVLVLAAQTPDQIAADNTSEVSDTLETSGAGATAAVSAMLETVLPPAMVELVLSPLLILEILVRTIGEGGRRVLGPLVLLGLSALLVFAFDRARGPARL